VLNPQLTQQMAQEANKLEASKKVCITIIDTIIHNYTQLYTIITIIYTNNAYIFDVQKELARALKEAEELRRQLRDSEDVCGLQVCYMLYVICCMGFNAMLLLFYCLLMPFSYYFFVF
jgi:hypothetical protein